MIVFPARAHAVAAPLREHMLGGGGLHWAAWPDSLEGSTNGSPWCMEPTAHDSLSRGYGGRTGWRQQGQRQCQALVG
jgi:hypothetical protein